MEGFKKLPKMQCFKAGGSVQNIMKKGGSVQNVMKEGEKADIAQDKKIIKKAFKQHDKAEHDKSEPTEIKLKKGGRSKKAVGTVKKFKAGGEVTNVYEAKKTSTDKSNIKKVKAIKPAKAKDSSTANTVKNSPAKFCGGKSVKKMAVGGQPGATEAQQKFYNKNKADAKVKEDKAMYEAVGSRGDAARKGMSEGRMDQMGTAYKKGGKAKKFAEGGSTGEFSSEEKAWLGGADATDPFILARMRSALGPKKPQGSYIPNADPTMDNRDVGMAKPYQAPNVEQDSGLAYPQENELRTSPMAPRRAPMLPAGPSADDRMRMKYARPYAAPNVEQDSGVAYPQGKAAPYINIPANNPGMRQFRTDAVSPIESAWNWLSKSRSQRNKKPIS
jgi:hypothetical protein